MLQQWPYRLLIDLASNLCLRLTQPVVSPAAQQRHESLREQSKEGQEYEGSCVVVMKIAEGEPGLHRRDRGLMSSHETRSIGLGRRYDCSSDTGRESSLDAIGQVANHFHSLRRWRNRLPHCGCAGRDRLDKKMTTEDWQLADETAQWPTTSSAGKSSVNSQ
jgi:hypothetical protein